VVVLFVNQLIGCAFDILEVKPFATPTMYFDEERVVVSMHTAALRMASYDVGGGELALVEPCYVKRV
jgi:hypothetical protein